MHTDTSRILAAALLCGFLLLPHIGCSTSPDDGGTSAGACLSDKDCGFGEECVGGCVPVRATVYPHIQLASPLLRDALDDGEIAWRARHADMLIGRTTLNADDMRGQNANARLFEYFTIRYHLYPTQAAGWAYQNGENDEDFYLHYREDVTLPDYAGIVLVPGFPPGTVPGWNPARGPNDPPASATDRSQSRAFGIRVGNRPPWPLANVHNPDYRRFATDFISGLIDGTFYGHPRAMGNIEGVVIDNAIYYPEFGEGQLPKTDEFYGIPMDDLHPYAIAFETFFIELIDALHGRFGGGADVMANYGHVLFLSRNDRFSQNVQQIVDWAWGEVWVTYRGGYTPTSGGNRVISYEADYQKGIANMVLQSRSGGRRVLGARDPGGGSDRGRLYTLALFYLIHNPNTFYVYEATNSHLEPGPMDTWQWNPAVTVDIGSPAPIPAGVVDFEGNSGTREHYVLESGPDPYDPSLTYYVLARNFTKGLVLVKMLPKGSVDDDRSITTHTLAQPYRVVRGDGTLSAPTTFGSLRNNEGVILVTP